MKNFVIITNNDKPKNVESGNLIKTKLESRGARVSWQVMPAPSYNKPMEIPEDTDVIISIGGDGTMVRTALRTAGKNIPLIGFNKGHLGYLCDINETELDKSLDMIMAGRFVTEERMMITGKLPENKSFNALNDIVLTYSGGQMILRINIFVNGTFLYSFNGDGIIVATPTGSTAYNLSANGPIVEPNTQLMLLTPINPHTLNSRSIILDSKDTIELSIDARRSRDIEKASVMFDGAERYRLKPGEKLTISKAMECAYFIRLDKTSFIERMNTRLGE